MHKELAKIRSTQLGDDDHGGITSFLFVDYDRGTSQGIGGYRLALWDKVSKDAYGMEFIRRTLKAVGASNWEELPGKVIYVLLEDEMYSSKVLGIAGTFQKKSEEFIFDDLAKEMGLK